MDVIGPVEEIRTHAVICSFVERHEGRTSTMMPLLKVGASGGAEWVSGNSRKGEVF